MSKREKGRKHRTVNRTPRPVGAARQPTAVSPAPAAPAAGMDRASERSDVREAPRGPARAPSESKEEDGPLFYNRVSDGGLGHHAARTWHHVKLAGAEGTTVDELCQTVGYQPPTILKHLNGLARYGMAEQRGDRWHSTGKSQWQAASERGLPQRTSDRAAHLHS